MDLNVIGALEAESRACPGFIAKQKTAGINRHIEPFVWIQREGISEGDPAEEGTLLLIERSECSISAVDMEPQAEFICDCRNFIQRIDGASVNSSSAGHHAKRFHAVSEIVGKRLAQRRHIHAKPLVRVDNPHLRTTQS